MQSKTIAALATAPGVAGIAVIRVSGTDAIFIVNRVFRGKIDLTQAKSHCIYYGSIYNDNEVIDQVTVSIFRSPNSYTGEDVVEIGCHGGYYIYTKILEILYSNGSSAALPGEFTRRAFINKKIDLAQAEAIGDLIHANSEIGATISARQLDGQFTGKINLFTDKLLSSAGLLELELDFAGEGLELIPRQQVADKITEAKDYCSELLASYKTSQILRNGYNVAIVGFPNSGKSSLFNILLDDNRAIVSDIAGTTRDYLRESLIIQGQTFHFFDTAGIRDSEDLIEIEGIKLVDSVVQRADLIIVLNDISQGLNYSMELYDKLKLNYGKEFLYINNKYDLLDVGNDSINISCKTSFGIIELKNKIVDISKSNFTLSNNSLINSRHALLLGQARDFLNNALVALEDNMENELIAYDIHKAIFSLGLITGLNYSEEVLNTVFSGFCIGK